MSTITFTQVAALWKADKRQYVKKSSYAAYVQHLNKHILPYFGSRNSFSSDDIQLFANSLIKQGLALNTIKDCILILKMVLRYGERLGVWAHIDCRVHYPATNEEHRSIPVLTRQQQQRLMQYLQDNFSFRNLGLYICIQSGLRIGEICALQWKDIDLATAEIHVSKTVSRVWISDGEEREYSVSVDTPKTASSVRDIPITRELTTILKSLRKVVNPDYYLVSNEPAPLEPRYYRDYFLKILAKLDIPPIRFHALRHSFATRCIESKCDYKTVSVILGHASIATTLDLYVHPGYNEKKKCIDRMAKSLAVR